MQVLERLKRKPHDRRCLACFALERAAATVEPHAHLTMAASVVTVTGERQEFTCNACGQRMARFLAHQTKPKPADVWRCEGAPGSPVNVAPAEVKLLSNAAETTVWEGSPAGSDDEPFDDGEPSS